MSDLEQAASELEQGLEQAAPTEGITESAPFSYAYQSDDGEERVFDSPDSLSKFIREGTLRHSDYTRKTQEVAAQRKEIEAMRKQIADQERMAKELEGKWKPIDEFIRTPRGQQLYKQIEQGMGSVSPNDVLDQSRHYAEEAISSGTKELMERLEALEQEREQERLEAERRQAIEALQGEYEDFNPDAVQQRLKELDELSSLPQTEQTKEFMRLVYQSLKAQENLAQLEQKFAGKEEKKKPPVSSKGAKKQVPEETGESLAEAEKLAAKEVEAML